MVWGSMHAAYTHNTSVNIICDLINEMPILITHKVLIVGTHMHAVIGTPYRYTLMYTFYILIDIIIM